MILFYFIFFEKFVFSVEEVASVVEDSVLQAWHHAGG